MLYLLRAVVGQIEEMELFFLSPEDVKSSFAYEFLPELTFGIQQGGIILTSTLFSPLFVAS